MTGRFRRFVPIVFTLFLLLLIRVFWLSVLSHDRLTREAVKQRVSEADLVTVRGSITDRNGTPLTDCREGEYAVYTDGADLSAGVPALAEQLGKSEELITAQIKNRTRLTFGPLNNLYPVERAGFMTVRATLRSDEQTMARHLIGTLDGEGRGNSGLEKTFESVLNTGRKQSIVSLRDVRQGLLHRWGYLEANRKVDTTRQLRLTLDAKVQQAVEKVADAHLQKGSIFVSAVDNGDVLAMVSRPQFNPADIVPSLKSVDGELINRSLTLYNAGSIYKIVVVAAALEYGIPQTGFYCTGSFKVGDRTCSCYNNTAHGWVDLEQAFSKSCNGYFVRLGKQIGMDRLLEMSRKLGLTLPVTNLEEEPTCLLPELTPVLPGRVANLSIGQGELLVTPVAMLRLLDIVANGGELRTLNVTDSIVDDQGLLVQPLRQTGKKRVLSGHTADRIKALLTHAVTEGTGKGASVPEVAVAGKTGTAETGWVEGGELQVHAWFCGFFPAEAPRYCVTVFMENGQSGGGRAAPVFSEVCKALINLF